MEENITSQEQAQAKVDQIKSFNQEFLSLEQRGIVAFDEQQKQSISQYHIDVLSDLTLKFDIDQSTQEKQLTWGMKIASLFGALAMAASLFFLCYQFWGFIQTSVQVSVLVILPIAFFILAIKLSAKKRNAYFSKIAAMLSLASFVLNLSMLGQIFNITPSPNAFLVWSLFAFVLAYACNARLLLIFAIVCFSSFFAMKIGTWSGVYWVSFGNRPENFFIPALLFFCFPAWKTHHKFSGFNSIYRVLAMIMAFLPMLILANWGNISYLDFSNEMIEGMYQVLGFVTATFAIWYGVKRGLSSVITTGNVFFILFLYTKMFDWWWQWMPKYLFFFLLGLCALLALLVFKRIRALAIEMNELEPENGQNEKDAHA